MQIDSNFHVVAAFGVASGVALILGFVSWRWRKAKGDTDSVSLSPTQIRSLARFFHERVVHFKSQAQTLHEHSNEYTSLFQSGEWGALTQTIAHLEQMNAQIQGLIVTKQFQRASALLKDLYDSEKHPLDSVQANIDSFKANADWEANVRGMLKRVVQNLEAATNQVKETSDPARSKKRRPTLMTLADVKKSLLEDEAFSREGNC